MSKTSKTLPTTPATDHRRPPGQDKQASVQQHFWQERVAKERVMQLQSVKTGLQTCVLGTLPKEELRDFLPRASIKERNAGHHDRFFEYAKQRELIANLDKKLDYHNLQKDRHPYINDLREAMQAKRSGNNSPQNGHTSGANSPIEAESKVMDYSTLARDKTQDVLARQHRFTSTQMDLQQSFKAAHAQQKEGEKRSQSMLRSERFRTTVNEPPYSSLYRANEIGSLVGASPGKRATLSKDQLHAEQISIDYKSQTAINQQKLGIGSQAYKAKLLAKLKEQSFIKANKRRTFSQNDKMTRWVGSSINFNEPVVEKISIKQSKKLNRAAVASHKVSIPDLIQSQYRPEIDPNFEIKAAPRFTNDDGKFIVMDASNRKVGRQRIPKEFFQREKQLQEAALKNFASATQLEPIIHGRKSNHLGGSGRMQAEQMENLRQINDKRQQEYSPSYSQYPEANSLPFSTSLRSLAQKSVHKLGNGTSPRYPNLGDYHQSTTFHHRNNSAIL